MRLATAFKHSTLGFGLVWPFRRLASSDFLAAEGEALIRSSVKQILGTRPGEIPWNPAFGINLERYRNKNANAGLGQAISQDIVAALQLWEPRIQVLGCAATLEIADAGTSSKNVIRIRVDWVVRTGALEGNNVLIGPVSQEVPV